MDLLLADTVGRWINLKKHEWRHGKQVLWSSGKHEKRGFRATITKYDIIQWFEQPKVKDCSTVSYICLKNFWSFMLSNLHKPLGLYIRTDSLSLSTCIWLLLQFYRALNIRVALVGLEVWSDSDKCPITQDPFTTLHEFLDWRKVKLLPQKPHDNAQLIRWKLKQEKLTTEMNKQMYILVHQTETWIVNKTVAISPLHPTQYSHIKLKHMALIVQHEIIMHFN